MDFPRRRGAREGTGTFPVAVKMMEEEEWEGRWVTNREEEEGGK